MNFSETLGVKTIFIYILVALASNAAAESISPLGSVDVYSIIRLTNYTYSQVNECVSYCISYLNMQNYSLKYYINRKKVLIIIEFDLLIPGSKINRSLYQEPLTGSSPEPSELFASAPAPTRPLVSQVVNKPTGIQ